MQINNNYSTNPTFGLIELKPKDLNKSKQLLHNITVPKLIQVKKDALTIELYNIFEPYLAMEAKSKAKKSYILEDVISDLKVKFWEIIQGANSKTSIGNIIEEIDTHKPSKNDLKPGYINVSIDAPIPNLEQEYYSELITKAYLPIPLSGIKIRNTEQTLSNTIKSSNLSETNKNRLTKKCAGLTYKSIAEEENNTYTTVFNSIQKSILKLQKSNNAISKENKEQISKLAQILGISFDEAFRAATKAANILPYPLDKLKSNLENSVKLLKISKRDFIKSLLNQPQILMMKPETLNRNIENSSDLLKIPKKDFVSAALKHSALFYIVPDTLNKNVEISANLFEISKNDFLEIALKNPVLFILKPETLRKKLKIIAYYKQIKNKNQEINILSCMRSSNYHYKNILNFLVRKNTDKGVLQSNMTLPQILELSTNKINIQIPKSEVVEDFIKFAKNYSIKTVGKNIFEFTIIE